MNFEALKYFFLRKDLKLIFFITFSVVVFIVSIIYGYIISMTHEEEMASLIKGLFESILGEVGDMGVLKMFAIIFLNNLIKSFFILFLGFLFGILPMIFIVVNGVALGSFAFFAQKEIGLFLFLVGVLPHGIIELPVLIMVSSLGFVLGHLFFKSIKKKDFKDLKVVANKAILVFWYTIFPLLLIAALLEVSLTPFLLSLFGIDVWGNLN